MLESLLIKLQAVRPANLLKRDSNTVFSCEYCEIFKNTYFEEHLRTSASVIPNLFKGLSAGRKTGFKVLDTILEDLSDNFGRFLYCEAVRRIQNIYDKHRPDVLRIFLAIKHQFTGVVAVISSFNPLYINPLSANPTKWSNTLKTIRRQNQTNCLSVFDHFVGLAPKGLKCMLVSF